MHNKSGFVGTDTEADRQGSCYVTISCAKMITIIFAINRRRQGNEVCTLLFLFFLEPPMIHIEGEAQSFKLWAFAPIQILHTALLCWMFNKKVCKQTNIFFTVNTLYKICSIKIIRSLVRLLLWNELAIWISLLPVHSALIGNSRIKIGPEACQW